jgi:hypothetical protein
VPKKKLGSWLVMATSKDIRSKLESMTDEEFDAFRRRLGSEHSQKSRLQIIDAFRFYNKRALSEEFFCELMSIPTEAEKVVTATIDAAEAAKSSARAAEQSAEAADKSVFWSRVSAVIAFVAIIVSLISLFINTNRP